MIAQHSRSHRVANSRNALVVHTLLVLFSSEEQLFTRTYKLLEEGTTLLNYFQSFFHRSLRLRDVTHLTLETGCLLADIC